MFNIKREGVETRSLNHNNDACLGCGICVDTCPTESLRLGPLVPIARGLIDMDYVSINEKTCVLCGLCAVSCPFTALSFKINDNNIQDLKNYPKWDISLTVNQEDCLYCGKCKSVCPRDAIIFERKLPKREDLVRGEISINEDDCLYCNICAEMCPTEAIELSCIPTTQNDVVANNISIDTSKCVFCKVCSKSCPVDAIMAICSTCMEQEDITETEITGNTFITESACVNCSWCEDVCPIDAINVDKPFEGTIKLVETEEVVCKGSSCHACQDVCSCNAVEIVDGKSVTNLTYCNLCGACIKACPTSIRQINRNSMKLININSKSWNKILNKLIE